MESFGLGELEFSSDCKVEKSAIDKSENDKEKLKLIEAREKLLKLMATPLPPKKKIKM